MPGNLANRCGLVAVPGPGDEAVIGAEDDGFVDADDQQAAIGADAGVDDGQVDRSGGKPSMARSSVIEAHRMS